MYYSTLGKYLSLKEFTKLSILSSFHNNFYKNPNNKIFLKKLVSYNYGKIILKWDFDIKLFYTDFKYLIKLVNKYFNKNFNSIDNISCDVGNEFDKIYLDGLCIFNKFWVIKYWFKNYFTVNNFGNMKIFF